MSRDKVCRDFMNGFCKFDNKCRFEHPKEKGSSKDRVGDSRSKTSSASVCKDYARGNCSFGERCRFPHPTPCKDYLQGFCKFNLSCRFYHPPGAEGAAARGGKRPMDGPGSGGFDELPPEYCKDFVYNGQCPRPRCNWLHEMPNKRQRGPDGPYNGPGGPGPVGPNGPGPMGPNGPGAMGPGYEGSGITAEMKAYVGNLELKLTMYEEKIKDLEKRCEQYEDFNKLLSERNDELKEKLDKVYSNSSSSRGAGAGGGSSSYNGAGYSSSRDSRPTGSSRGYY